MLHKVYKELMILGFIQFAFILLKDFGYIYPTVKRVHCFDFSLLLVTFTVFLYIFNTMVGSFGMHVSKREWDRVAMKSCFDIVGDLEKNLPPDKPTCGQRFKHATESLIKETLGVGKHWRKDADFKVVELLFKTKFYLSRSFDYNQYLALVLEDVVISMSNITPFHWIIVSLSAFLYCIYMPAIHRSLSDCIYTPAIDRSLSPSLSVTAGVRLLFTRGEEP